MLTTDTVRWATASVPGELGSDHAIVVGDYTDFGICSVTNIARMPSRAATIAVEAKISELK